MLKNEGDPLKRVVVCTPGYEYFHVNDLKAQNFLGRVDQDRTILQHNRLKTLMNRFGSEVIDVSELGGHPNSVFTRDVALVTPKGYIKLRMGLPARRGEEEWMDQMLDSIGEPCAGEIKEPGTVEGGDVILAGSVAFIGLSKRTNKEGARQLSALLEGMDYEVRTAPVQSYSLHLGGMMSMIAPDKILHCGTDFPNQFFNGYKTIKIPRTGKANGNVICLGDNEVIANMDENIIAINKLEESGLKVHRTDLSEFRKGGGGPTCLILPVERG
jgi:dimethylargininase